jgi:Protein of unknown function (DUF3606)
LSLDSRDGSGARIGDHKQRLLEPKRIDMSREYEIQYWARAFGVGREALEAAVGVVGNDARAVSRQLGKG